MLLHIAHSDDLTLTRDDFERAIVIVRQLEKKLPNVFQSIGNNTYTVDIYRILDYVIDKGSVDKAEIHRHFMHAATPSMLDELIGGLDAAGFIEVRVNGNKVTLVAKPLELKKEKPPDPVTDQAAS
jgi:hypothetical protein